MYDKPIGPVKPINIENIKKNEELIDDIEKKIRSKSTRNIRALKKKYSVIFKDELLNNLFDAQQYNDFFPTSQKCLTHFDDYSNYIEKEENILEPSAGIGSIVHYLQKKGYKNIEANDFDQTIRIYVCIVLNVRGCCSYIYMYIHIHVYIYIYIYIYSVGHPTILLIMYVCMCVCMYVCLRMHARMYIHVHIQCFLISPPCRLISPPIIFAM